MVDVAAAMTRRVADSLKEIAPTYAFWLNECADAKEEIERLREALRKISNSDTCGCQMECVDMCKIANAALKENE